jgi:hypothetical protein
MRGEKAMGVYKDSNRANANADHLRLQPSLEKVRVVSVFFDSDFEQPGRREARDREEKLRDEIRVRENIMADLDLQAWGLLLLEKISREDYDAFKRANGIAIYTVPYEQSGLLRSDAHIGQLIDSLDDRAASGVMEMIGTWQGENIKAYAIAKKKEAYMNGSIGVKEWFEFLLKQHDGCGTRGKKYKFRCHKEIEELQKAGKLTAYMKKTYDWFDKF